MKDRKSVAGAHRSRVPFIPLLLPLLLVVLAAVPYAPAHAHGTHAQHGRSGEGGSPLLALASAFAISLLSLSGGSLLLLGRQTVGCGTRLFLSALAVGCMLGDVFFHLLPHCLGGGHDHEHGRHNHGHAHGHGEGNDVKEVGVYVLCGFFLMMLVELAIRVKERSISRHQKQQEKGEEIEEEGDAMGEIEVAGGGEEEDGSGKGKGQVTNNKKRTAHAHAKAYQRIKPVGWLNLIGDGVHNFVDGMFLAAAFSTSTTLGMANTFAIVLHELPQEMADLGVLLAANFTPFQALWFNFLSGVVCMIGCLTGIVGLHVGGSLSSSILSESTMLAITAGSFLYMSCVDMIPDLFDTVVDEDGDEKTGGDGENKVRREPPSTLFRRIALATTGIIVGLSLMLIIEHVEHWSLLESS